jgi:uncharacterized protein
VIVNRYGIVLVLVLCLAVASLAQRTDVKGIQVLLYTKNGKGYVHENIPSAIGSIKKIGEQNGFTVTATEDPSVFTTENLKKFTLLLFASTNNDVFDNDEQRLAFRQYIEAGGGFVGLHSVVGTERNWKWFKMMLGGTFAWHPKFQKYRIITIDAQHPSVKNIPKVWEKEDECYFQKEMYPGIHTIMAHDLTSLDASEKEKITAHSGPYAELFPAVWYQKFDSGTIWITTLGHDKKDYADPTYIQHILNGISFVAGQVTKVDFKKAYATSKDEPLK